MAIINKRHSPNASLTVYVAVDQGVSAAQLRALHAAVSAFARARPLEWRPKVSMSIGATDAAAQPPNRVNVAFSLTHHASWQEPSKISAAHAELAVAVLEVRGDYLGVSYTMFDIATLHFIAAACRLGWASVCGATCTRGGVRASYAAPGLLGSWIRS